MKRMNGKVYIVVSVPMIEQNFDLYIPTTKKVGTVKNLILKMIEEESEQNFIADQTKSLYDKESGERINEEEYVKDSVIKNGSKLILF